MKRLKLKALQLGAFEMLTKEQMKKVNGGTGTCSNAICSLFNNTAAGVCRSTIAGGCGCIFEGGTSGPPCV
jgi:hypothetical protein